MRFLITVFEYFFVEVIIPPLTVYWQQRYYSASEADGSVEVCAELSTLEFTGSVEVDYATLEETAEGSSIRNVFNQHVYTLVYWYKTNIMKIDN